MMNMIGSRRIAEHLCTFARLLEAEAMRASTLGIRLDRDLSGEARDVRHIADQLWDANVPIRLDGDGRAPVRLQIAGEPAFEAVGQPRFK